MNGHLVNVQIVELRHGEHALKIARKIEMDDGPDELAAFKARAMGFFRSLYGEWPEPSVRIVPSSKF